MKSTEEFILTVRQSSYTLRNIMLSGEAPTLVRTMSELKGIKEFRNIRLFRIVGTYAFSDYSTLDAVNLYQNKKVFQKTPRLVDATENSEAEAVVKKTGQGS